MGNAGLVGRPWRTAQAKVFAEETHCWICGTWVDPDLPPRDPMARSADHIIPRDEGGPLYDRTNLRLAHIRCNTIRSNKRRAQLRRQHAAPSRPWQDGHRQVTLICGPPCAGKTTWVQAQKNRGDEVVDADLIAHELGSTAGWDHGDYYIGAAQAEWWQRVRAIGQQDDITAWIIRCAPTAYERRRIGAIAQATRIVILLPDHATLASRAATRPNPARTLRTVQQWLNRYTQHRDHEIITTQTTNTQVTASRTW